MTEIELQKKCEEFANKFCDDRNIPGPYSDQIVYELGIEAFKAAVKIMQGEINVLDREVPKLVMEIAQLKQTQEMLVGALDKVKRESIRHISDLDESDRQLSRCYEYSRDALAALKEKK